ncbi:MAG TPA: hypothetical protein VHF69_08340 [Candidatus Synoicihabitans sp.]|nr:hypothetical protein [Candidatus Synoicihabitans sp.]
MGYIIAGVVFVVGALMIAFLLSSRSGRARGRLAPGGVKPVEHAEPAADQPTPGASTTADPETAERAQRRMPPS